MQNFFKKYGYAILLGLVVLFGVLLRLKGLLANPSFWHDECALAWNIKFKTYPELFGILRFLQVSPPFFLVLTKLITKIFGFSEISFRLLPFTLGVASIIAFYFLAEKVIKSKVVVIWAVFFFAINQTLINYSFEFRSYGLDAFFGIICLLFFVNLDVEKLNAKKALLYGILLSVVPWFSFTSVFIIAGGVLNILFKSIKNKSKAFLFPLSSFLFPLILSILIYAKIYLLNNYTGTSMVSGWQSSFLTLNPLHCLSLLVDNLRYFFFPMPLVLFGLILFFWGIIIFYKEGYGKTPKSTILRVFRTRHKGCKCQAQPRSEADLALTGLGRMRGKFLIFSHPQEKSKFIEILTPTFVLFIIASLLKIYPFSTRLILFMLPIFLLFMIKPLDSAVYGKKIKLFAVLLLMFFTFYPQIVMVNRFIHTKDIARGEHPREMMESLIKNIKPSDIVIVSNDSNTEFAYYSSFYSIKNQIIQEPQKINHKKFLNSLEKKKNYWFYLTFQDSKMIQDWIAQNSAKIKLVYRNNLNDYLLYVYLK